jgi:hypothetical protein
MARHSKRPPADHHAISAALRSTPQQWQKVHTYRTTYTATSTANHICRGRLTAYQPSGAFEARTEPDPDGATAVYARYLGTDGVWQEALRALTDPEPHTDDIE